jgi:hypothetical protein
MDEADAMSRARPRHVGGAFRVHCVRRASFCLGPVDGVVSGAVEHQRGAPAAQESVKSIGIGHGHLVMRDARAMADQA